MMDPPQDFKTLQESIQAALLSTVKATNRVAAEDLSFQRTANPSIAAQLDDATERILATSTGVLQSAAKACGVKAPNLQDVEDVDMNWRKIVDVVDSLLEKAATALDEYTGAVKRRDPPASEPVSTQCQSPFA
jgi:exosome complex exonuclease RRP6